MEMAYCLLQTGDQDDLTAAERLYEAIEEEYEKDVVSRFRHGLVFRRRRLFDHTADKYREAIAILEGEEDGRVSKDHWVQSAVWRNLGYNYWKKSGLHPNSPDGERERLADLRQAIICTQTARRKPANADDQIATMNNLIYFGWCERQVPLEDVEFALNQIEYEGAITEFSNLVDWSNSTRARRLDTLCKGLWSLPDQESRADARAVAGRILEIMKDRIFDKAGIASAEAARVSEGWFVENAARYLNEGELEIFLFALAVYNS
jgi:hypothetical protein